MKKHFVLYRDIFDINLPIYLFTASWAKLSVMTRYHCAGLICFNEHSWLGELENCFSAL